MWADTCGELKQRLGFDVLEDFRDMAMVLWSILRTTHLRGGLGSSPVVSLVLGPCRNGLQEVGSQVFALLQSTTEDSRDNRLANVSIRPINLNTLQRRPKDRADPSHGDP